MIIGSRLQVANIGRNDRAPANHFAPHELKGSPSRAAMNSISGVTCGRAATYGADEAGPPARVDPRLAQLRQTAPHVAAARATRVMQANRRFPRC